MQSNEVKCKFPGHGRLKSDVTRTNGENYKGSLCEGHLNFFLPSQLPVPVSGDQQKQGSVGP